MKKILTILLLVFVSFNVYSLEEKNKKEQSIILTKETITKELIKLSESTSNSIMFDVCSSWVGNRMYMVMYDSTEPGSGFIYMEVERINGVTQVFNRQVMPSAFHASQRCNLINNFQPS